MKLLKQPYFSTIAFLLWTAWASAQVSLYTFSQSAGTYSPISGGIVLGTATSDDDVFVDPAVLVGNNPGAVGVGLPIGFNFIFDGIVYDRLGVSNNGWICFGQSIAGGVAVNTNSASSYTAISSNSNASPLLQHRVAGYARDLQAQVGSEIRMQTIGTAPNRVCVIQWSNYRRWGAAADNLNFQIRLTESSNIIETVYGTWTTSAVTAQTGQVGLRGGSNTNYNNRSVVNGTSTWATSNAGGANNSSCAFLSSLLPNSGQTYRWTPPSCAAPNAMALIALTNTSAGFDWGRPIAQGQLVVVPQGNAATTGIPTPVSGTTATIGSLTANTNYSAYIRQICGAGDTSVWTLAVNFTTACAPLTPLWTDGFESIATAGAGIVPSCWAKTGDFSSENGTQSNNRVPRTGTKYGYTQWSTVTGVGDHLFTPGFNLTAGVVYEFSFYYQSDGIVGWDSVRVGVGVAPVATAGVMNYIGTRIVNPTNTTYQKHLVTFVPSATGVYYFTVNVFAPTSAPNYLVFDDFRLEAPTCSQPGSLAVNNIQPTSAAFSWVSFAPGSSWYVSTVPQGSAANAATAILTNSNPFTFTGLTPNTAYTTYVREYCSAGDTSAWSLPVDFRTPCNPTGTLGDSMQTAFNVTATNYSTTNNTAFCYTNTLGNASPDVWYRVILDPCATTISASLCTGTNFDTYLRLFAADGTTLLASNDDACSPYSSFSGINVAAHDTVYVVVEGTGSNVGTYGLNISQTLFVPVANIGYAQASYCQNTTNNPIPTNAGSAGGFFSELTNTLNLDNISGELYLNTAAPATYSIVYTVGTSSCQSRDTAIVVSTAPDNASFNYAGGTNGQTAFCTNVGLVNPSITGVAGGTFSSSPAGLNLNATNGAIDISASPTGTYTVQYLTNGTCPNTATFDISIDTVQNAAFNYPQTTVCANNANVLPIFTGVAGGTFAAMAGLTFNIHTGEINVTNSTPATYTITYTTPNACASQATASFTINPLVNASFAYSQATYCQNAANPAPIIMGVAGGLFSSGTGLPVDVGTGVIDLEAATTGVPHTVTYSVNGACSNFEVVTITVLPADDASFHYDSITYCQGVTIPAATVTGDAGGTFTSLGALMVNASTGAILNLNTVATGTYTVQYATNISTCRDTATVSVQVVDCTISSVGNLSNTNDYRVFPNPNKGSFWVVNEGASQDVTIQVMDVLGQVLYRQENVQLGTNATFQIQLSQLAAGTYLVQLQHKKQTQTFKIAIVTE